MAADNLNPPPAPQRVLYATGRMMGVQGFQADQDYHRSRLARDVISRINREPNSGRTL